MARPRSHAQFHQYGTNRRDARRLNSVPAIREDRFSAWRTSFRMLTISCVARFLSVEPSLCLQIENCIFGRPAACALRGARRFRVKRASMDSPCLYESAQTVGSCGWWRSLTCGFTVSRTGRELNKECSFRRARSDRDFPAARDMPKVEATSLCGSSCSQHFSTYSRRDVGSARTALLTISIDSSRIRTCSGSILLFASGKRLLSLSSLSESRLISILFRRRRSNSSALLTAIRVSQVENLDR
jgi:hypothetical protein